MFRADKLLVQPARFLLCLLKHLSRGFAERLMHGLVPSTINDPRSTINFHRCSSGTTFRCGGPTYFAGGRIRPFDFFWFMLCALHPVMRAVTNRGREKVR